MDYLWCTLGFTFGGSTRVNRFLDSLCYCEITKFDDNLTKQCTVVRDTSQALCSRSY